MTDEKYNVTYFVCVYCGHMQLSYNGTGSDVVCCGEVGHCYPVEAEEEDMP